MIVEHVHDHSGVMPEHAIQAASTSLEYLVGIGKYILLTVQYYTFENMWVEA
jgi:transposase